MGQVPGEVVATAFGCFNPPVVVAGGQRRMPDRRPRHHPRWPANVARPRCCIASSVSTRTGSSESPTCCRRGAASAPWAGRPIYSGLLSLGAADDPLGAMWRAADLLREHRGDSHVITWAVGGVDAVEILLLTEQWWGLPPRAYTPSRGWQAADLDAGFDRLRRRGLMTDDEQLTDAGRAFREEIEVRTDELERPIIDALGDDLDELLDAPRHLVAGDRRRRLLPQAGRRRVQRRRRTTLRVRTDHRHRRRALHQQDVTD